MDRSAAAGLRGHAARDQTAETTRMLPQPYVRKDQPQRRMLPRAQQSTAQDPPYALGYELKGADPPPVAGPAAAPPYAPSLAPYSQNYNECATPSGASASSNGGAAVAQSIGKSLSVQNSARIIAAFAKYDRSRQGQLAPSDFAAAMRDLGVDVSAKDAASLKQQPSPTMGHLSSETVDYLKFVASLSEPPTAQSLHAAAAAVKPPPAKEPAKRLFGAHAHARHSNITTLPSYFSQPSPAATALHSHEAFADRAGVPADLSAAATARKGAAPPPPSGAEGEGNPIFHDGSRGAGDHRRAASATLLDVSDDAPTAGLSVARHAAWTLSQSRATIHSSGGSGTGGSAATFCSTVLPSSSSAAYDISDGGDLTSTTAASYAPPPPRPAASDPPSSATATAGVATDAAMPLPKARLPHQMAEADEVIFGHDQDGSASVPPLTSHALFEGAAGVDSRPMRAPFGEGLTQAQQPPVLMPHMASVTDSLVLGRDLDGSDGAAPFATHDEMRHAGAAGQYDRPMVPLPHIGEAEHRPSEMRPIDPRPTSLCGREGGVGSATSARPSRRGHIAPPNGRSTSPTQRAHVGPPPQRSPIMPRWAMPTAASSGSRAGGGGGGGAAAASPSPVVLAPAPAPTAGVPAGTRVLRLSQSPPMPPRNSSRFAEAGAASIAMPPAAPRAAYAQGESGATVSSSRAAGRPTARSPTRFLGATPEGDGRGSEAAGRRYCSLSAMQRKYGGQIAATGGLG